MAKSHYKIPATLDQRHADMEITFQSKDGMSLKPIPVKVLLVVLSSLMLMFMVLVQTFMSRASIPTKIVFGLCWIGLTVVFASFDATKRMQIQLVPALLSYLPSSSRRVYTRMTNNANSFYTIVGVESIDPDTGLVKHTDGTYGLFYQVVGSASILLFDEDKSAIIDRVDRFFRKWDIDSECIFITTQEGQKVYRQLAALQTRYQNLKIDSDELRALCEDQFTVLKKHIGQDYQSIHQYLEIKANSKDALRRSQQILRSEVENSSRMFKRCTPLDKDEIDNLFKKIYGGR